MFRITPWLTESSAQCCGKQEELTIMWSSAEAHFTWFGQMHFNRVQICKKQQVCATFPRFSLETFFKLALTASVCHAMAMSWHSGAWPGLRCCLQGYTRRCTSLSREIQAHHYFHLVQALLACVHFFRIACKYLKIHWTPNLVGPTWFI